MLKITQKVAFYNIASDAKRVQNEENRPYFTYKMGQVW